MGAYLPETGQSSFNILWCCFVKLGVKATYCFIEQCQYLTPRKFQLSLPKPKFIQNRSLSSPLCILTTFEGMLAMNFSSNDDNLAFSESNPSNELSLNLRTNNIDKDHRQLRKDPAPQDAQVVGAAVPNRVKWLPVHMIVMLGASPENRDVLL